MMDAEGPTDAGGPVVVVGVDGSENARWAVKWAADEVRRQGAVLHVLCAVDGGGAVERRGRASDGGLVGRTVVDDAVGLVGTRHPSVMVRGQVDQGPADEVLTRSGGSAELLVVGARDEEVTSTAPLGSVSDYCVRLASGPVAVVHADPDRHAYRGAERLIVVGIDGSRDAEAALRWALTRAVGHDTAVRGVTVTDPTARRAGSDPRPGNHVVLQQAREAARTTAPEVTFEVDCREGQPVDELVEGLGEDDLLVVGARGQRPTPGRPVGSIALGCAHRALSPVVVLRDPGSAADGGRDRH